MPPTQDFLNRLLHLQKTGDVVLVGEGDKPSPNLAIQSLLTFKRAKYAHVLLCVMPGLYIHSTPRNGVYFLDAEDSEADFPGKYGQRWAAFRNPPVAGDTAIQGLLLNRANFYFGQIYNWGFHSSPLFGSTYNVSHSFCSELIARVFSDIGFPLFNGNPIPPERMLPTHIASAIQRQSWNDVTEDYRQMFQNETIPEPEWVSNFSRMNVQLSLATRTLIKNDTMSKATSAAIHTRAKIETNRLTRLTKSFNELVKELDEGALKELRMKINELKQDAGFNPRSIQSEYDFRLSAIFAVDQEISEPQPKPQHFTEEMYNPEVPFWMNALEGAEEIGRRSASNLTKAANAAADCTQMILYITCIIRSRNEQFSNLTIHDELMQARESLQNNIKQYAEQCAATIQRLQDYDDYNEEVKGTNVNVLKRLGEQPLMAERTRMLVGRILKELHYRSILTEIKNALEVMVAEPENFDAALRAYSLAAQLLPFPETG
jgi:hypothetical protein